MSGPDPTTIGSNWKILQQRLQAEKRANGSSTSSGVKRKRVPEKSSNNSSRKTVTSFKRKKFDFNSANSTSLGKRRKMGGAMSTTKDTELVTDHDIPQSDITAAYGTTATTVKKRASFADEINGGLHPTNKIGKYIALDCEMVGTGPPPHLDNILARASLVNFHGEQIYDSYVQTPQKVRIEDYRTYVSGIKAHHLKPENGARPFTQVQSEVAKLMEGRILVGHALRNDLSALMFSHPKRDMRDTSRYSKFRVESKGKTPALRNLARSELGLEIQSGEHSSVEDARATMLLFQKEKKGFEGENRRQFGQKKVVAVKGKAAKEDTPELEGEHEEEGEEEEEEDDLDLLSGEELEDALSKEASKAGKLAHMNTKKKTKKKKRTKRK